jgi:DNA-binding transcriptional MerR regulator
MGPVNETRTHGFTVGQVAELAGVTVRTLHHYDEIGLVSPRERTPAGYRRYSDADTERLHQVLSYRELGFSLEEIATILDDPEADATSHLRRQHRLLTERIARLELMVAAVEKAMEATQMGIRLTPEERFEVFGDHDPGVYDDEARDRWGETDAYKESQRRASGYTKDDWLRIKAEGAAIEQGLATALAAGVAPTSEDAMDLAEQHRQQITRWFYDCPYAMHRGLADMYIGDPRFTAHYEDVAPGLGQYLHDAIHANADRAA